MTTTPTPCAVRVCFDRDMECGNNPRAWCSTCPKRAPGADLATDELITLLTAATNASFDCGAHDCDGDAGDPAPYARLARISAKKREAVVDFFRASLAAVPASEPASECRWPNCESEATQQALAKEVAESLFGAAAPVSGILDLASLADAMKSARYVYGKESIALQCLDYLQALINNPLPEFGPVGAFHAGETK